MRASRPYRPAPLDPEGQRGLIDVIVATTTSHPGSSGGSNGPGRSPWTPGINGANQSTALTSNTQPVIDLLSEIQH
jgi:hypothetical protein